MRFVIAISVHYEWDRVAVDIKTEFLNADWSEEIYVSQLEGFGTPGSEKIVYRLLKELYRLKLANRQWHKTLHAFLISIGIHAITDASL